MTGDFAPMDFGDEFTSCARISSRPSGEIKLGGGGGGIGWVGHGKGLIGAYIARRRAIKSIQSATEAHMTENGIPIPPKPMSQERVFAIGFACGLLLGLLIGLIFWELT